MKFDDYRVYPLRTDDPYHRRTVGKKNDALPGGGDHPFGPQPPLAPNMSGEGVIAGFSGDDYTILVDSDQNAGLHADVLFRITDRSNRYRVRVQDTQVDRDVLDNGDITNLGSGTYTLDDTVAVRIKVAGTSLDVWINGTSEISVTDSTHGSGGVGLAGNRVRFDDEECRSPT